MSERVFYHSYLLYSLPSPDSRTMDSELVVTEVTSPDPITTPSSYSPSYPSPLVPVWSGSVSMHGLETASVLAYPVSGPIDTIDIQQVSVVYSFINMAYLYKPIRKFIGYMYMYATGALAFFLLRTRQLTIVKS